MRPRKLELVPVDAQSAPSHKLTFTHAALARVEILVGCRKILWLIMGGASAKFVPPPMNLLIRTFGDLLFTWAHRASACASRRKLSLGSWQ